MSYLFNHEIKETLFISGWRPNRSINIDYYLSVLEEKGYYVHRNTKNFFRQLSGIRIEHEAYSDPTDIDVSDFTPTKLVDWLDPLWMEYYENIIGDRLCPIGIGFSEHIIFFLSESGRFYGGYDDCFYLIGNDIESALKNLFFEHDFTQL
ncbi:SUKH-3 domain-containing protein [Xenorhabdus sp. ZM]|uniref:SUKH-3 domain-containing protein n=1 Tax=Xenorhabdus szentirmaii TaxID=290112 RepID=UPI0019CC56CD|nr:SUKH-3 domain-containing protein [Xenorhabdus sp. ZM]MBD2806990.1 SUKH-3 domain-containing protein [Xenorhabdus sp. ZM]